MTMPMTTLIARIADLIHEGNYYVCSGKKRGRDCEACVRTALEITDIFVQELAALDAEDAAETLRLEANYGNN